MLKVKEDNEPVDAEEVGRLIALAYPERIAMAIDNIGHFRMSNGKTIFIDSSDTMSAQQWLAILAQCICSAVGHECFHPTSIFRKGRQGVSLGSRKHQRPPYPRVRQHLVGQ